MTKKKKTSNPTEQKAKASTESKATDKNTSAEEDKSDTFSTKYMSHSVIPDAIEPHEYFKVLKDHKKSLHADQLQKQLDAIAVHIIKARDIGQKSLLEKLSFMYETIIKEQTLLANGFDKFVYDDDIKCLVDKVKNIKMIELSRYPRLIPDENQAVLKKVKDLGVFEEFLVVFTDYTDNDYKTEAEKEAVKRNRDPIIFGYFMHKDTGIKHNRYHFITDWEDEYCDLTFTKLITKMAEVGITEAEHTLTADKAYIDELVRSTLENMKKKPHSHPATKPEEPKVEENLTGWQRLKAWFKKWNT